MDKKIFDKLRQQTKEFMRINFWQYSDMNKNIPTGLFCTVFTEIKKDSSMEKIRSVISDLKCHFEVTESGLERTKHFIIKL